MNILITGIHGFVGSNLVKALCSKHQIYGIDIVSPVKDGVINTFSWDDLDHGIIPNVDAIIHLAGKAHDTKRQAEADVYFKINTLLTQKIYDYYLKSQAKTFIFFSSVKAAADTVVVSPLTEDIIPTPIGPYGESKIQAERYIQSKWDIVDKRTVILRPCMIHGPGNKGNLNLLYGVVRKRIPWPLGSFDNLRSFTSIDNLCFVINKILTDGVPTGIYNIADDEPIATNTLIKAICNVLGFTPHIWHIPKSVMMIIADLCGILHLPLNSERLRKLTENYVVSNSKLKKALDIEQMPVKAIDGIKKTIISFAQR